MELINDTGFEAAWLISKINPPAVALTAIVKGTFEIRHGDAAVPAEEQLPPTGDEFEEDDPAKPPRYAFDFAPFKPRTDLLLAGQCHAPGGRPVTKLPVSFQIGRLTKSLVVFGDRYWLGQNSMTDPLSFAAMPLAWDRGFGGPGFGKNPLGKGHKEIATADGSVIHPLPNVELPRNLISYRRQQVEPAGFGPIPDSWPQRMKKFGAISDTYLKERWPWYPENFDWGFFNYAPEDQQVEGYLRGDEELFFENLHPTTAQYRSRLPGVRVRCFLNEQVRAHWELREVPMRLDTLWVDPGKERLILLWRGNATVRSERLLQVHHLFAMIEPLSQTPSDRERVIALFHDALVRREDQDEELEPEEAPEEEAEEEVEDEEDEAEEPQKEELNVSAESEPEEQAETEEAESGIPGEDTTPVSAEVAASDPELEEVESEQEEGVPDDEEDTLTVERVKEKILRGESFEGCDLTGQVLTGVDFSGLNLREAVLEGAVLIQANLSGADLSGAVLAGANLREADCAGAIFAGADLTEAWLFRANLTGADLRGADLSKADLRHAALTNAQAAESIFEEADLSDARLNGAGLSAADLCKTRLHRTDFTGANLDEVAIEEAWGRHVKAQGAKMYKLRGAKAVLCEANLQEIHAEESVWEFAQLYGSNFSRAQLNAAEFAHAYLGETVFDAADLKSARMEEANFRKARLHRSNLFEASLAKADLTWADLTESNLYGATLIDSVLNQTNFRGANLRRIKSKGEVT
ncbi:MAG: DUF2169 domain-containing protein [Candidatus Manganitrophaceae bacterium]